MKKIPRLRLRVLLSICIALSCIRSLQAQTFDKQSSSLPVISLNGQWRFHPGDNPAWAAPDFNDTHWDLQDSGHVWDSKLYPAPDGMGWYRFKVTLPPDSADTTLNLPHIIDCYEVFANGQLLGGYGKMPPNATPYWGGFNKLFTIPPAIVRTGTVVIAIRVWHWPPLARFYGGGPLYGGGMIGESRAVRYMEEQTSNSRHWIFNSTLILALLETLAAIGALALYLLRLQDREYLGFCLVQASSAAISWLALSYYFTEWPVILHNQLEALLLGPCLNLAEVAFYFWLLKGRRTPLFWIALGCSAASVIYCFLSGTFVLNSVTAYLGQDLLMLPVTIWILTLLFTRARHNYLDARLLVAPVVLQKAAMLFQQAAIVTSLLGWQHTLDFAIPLASYPFRIELLQVVNALFLLTVLTILILRFTRTRSHEERYASEVEGARSVQQFLIPEDLPAIPGLKIESDYRPAREVGGDFFQIIPHPQDGSALIFIGDLAGKGMQAGMLATLLVGAIRTAAAFTHDPVVILSNLNNRLCGNGSATALALRIEPSGAATLVNAGHLPPYINGIELPMEGALPLGTIPNLDFPVLNFQLSPGDTLTLISDGILEAQKPDGELFGFDRIAELLRNHATAAQLASAAQSFGHGSPSRETEQADDITVLTITR